MRSVVCSPRSVTTALARPCRRGIVTLLCSVLCLAVTAPTSAGTPSSPVNGLIAVDGGGTVLAVAPDGSGSYQVFPGGTGHPTWSSPAWSPDGATLAAGVETGVLFEDRMVHLGDRLGQPEPVEIRADDPAWTPSGDLVVVRRSTWPGTELVLMERTGQEIRRLAGGESILITDPVVSPDGQTVAYERYTSADGRGIYTVPITGGPEQRLATGHVGWVNSADWSPDGTRLLFVADNALWTMSRDGGERTQVVPASEVVREATWSPDGLWMAYTTARNGDLWLLEAGTGARSSLPLRRAYDTGEVDWQPLPDCSVTGTDGSDVLTGTPADDVVCAGGGDDRVLESPGDDIVLGGTGTDIAEYDASLPAVRVDLERMLSSGAGSDFHMSTEGAVGTAGQDHLVGDAESETFAGGPGDDTIAGGQGDDVLDAGAGRDTLASNYGDLRADLDGYDIDLVAGTVHERGINEVLWTDVVRGFEDVVGTPARDVIRGDDGDNLLAGGAAGEGDTFQGRGGRDTIIGPNSTVLYTDARSGVQVDLVAGTASGGDGPDSLVGAVHVQGSPYADRIRLVRASTGAGGAGNDVVEFSAWARFDGGPGRDLLDLGDLARAVEVHVPSQSWWFYKEHNPDPTRLGIPGFERFTLTPAADWFFGSTGSETVHGGAGADKLLIGPGADSANGGGGADTLYFDQPAAERTEGDHDRLFGGTGHDLLNAWRSGSALRVDLGAGWAQAPGVDLVAGLESVYGSEHADRLLGGGRDDVLYGYRGADVLRGRLGADRLGGQGGPDSIYGGPGRDECHTEPVDTVVAGCP